MKRKSVALIAILSMMLSITACGSKADDTSKESTKESQVVVESSTEEKTETHETTESEAVVETTETTESEKTVVTDSRFDVEIIGTCAHWDGTNVTVYSITNVSDASYDMWGSSQIAYEDENKYGNMTKGYDDR